MSHLLYDFAPGRWNAVKVWIRRHTRFGIYQRWVAPLIGWPRVISRMPTGPDTEYWVKWRP